MAYALFFTRFFRPTSVRNAHVGEAEPPETPCHELFAVPAVGRGWVGGAESTKAQAISPMGMGGRLIQQESRLFSHSGNFSETESTSEFILTYTTWFVMWHLHNQHDRHEVCTGGESGNVFHPALTSDLHLNVTMAHDSSDLLQPSGCMSRNQFLNENTVKSRHWSQLLEFPIQPPTTFYWCQSLPQSLRTPLNILNLRHLL